MKMLRLLSHLLPGFVVCVVFSSAGFASGLFSSEGYGRVAQFHTFWLENGFDQFEKFPSDTSRTIVKTPTDGGIREDVPVKYKDRFERWKSELL